MLDSQRDTPDKLVAQIIVALLPAKDDIQQNSMDPVDVARFVQGQLNVLPTRFRCLFALGMLGFSVVTMVRFARPFTRLSPEKQRAWVNQWAYGRVRFARQLFRVLRSTALMAYYEVSNGDRTQTPNPTQTTTPKTKSASGILSRYRSEVIVVGSGAGGAATALELANAGRDVLVLEEGNRHPADAYGQSPTTAMQLFYRNRGMTPIGGRVPIGHVEGSCLGGSTEINSGIWHHVPEAVVNEWNSEFVLDLSLAELQQHFEWYESLLRVGTVGTANWPRAAHAFAKGSQRMGYDVQEVRRAAPGCKGTNSCAWACPTGAKQGMSRSLIPRAEAAGARFLSNCRALRLIRRGSRVIGVDVELQREDGSRWSTRLEADHVFVCAGATQTPAFLRRSGIRKNVGDSFLIHPFLKVAAKFKHAVDSETSVFSGCAEQGICPGDYPWWRVLSHGTFGDDFK